MFKVILLGVSLSLPIVAQETIEEEHKPPAIELLTMSGSKPNLSPTGEGITSIKTTDLYQRGVTSVKPYDKTFNYELPTGYTLFNKLVYIIDSEAVFSGPDDFVFRIPSATTKESFDKLRILYAERDSAEPEKPRWIDATLTPGLPSYLVDYLNKADFDKRLPDFKTRTLHAFMEHASSFMIVALKDTALARDNFVADLSLTGTAPEQVMEGRHVTYDLKITNNGPDTATGITLHAQPAFEFVSASASQGTCRMEAGNVYCKLASLEKGKSLYVKIIEQCRWGSYSPNSPNGYGGKHFEIAAAEADLNYQDDSLFLPTSVIEDPNKAPVAEIISPKQDEIFAGPDPNVTIIARASDPDGFVNKIEFFDQGVPLGEGTLTSAGEYQLVYKKAALGQHWVEIKLTDNLGREWQERLVDFFVNGPASVEITDPKAGALWEREGETSVTIHAGHPKLGVKEVKVYVSSEGYAESKAVPISNDLYVAKVDCSYCRRIVEIRANVVDDAGIESRSAPVSFKIRKPPVVTLHYYVGEELGRLTEDQPVDFLSGSKLVVALEDETIEGLNLVKVDFFANGKLIETYTQKGPNSDDNRYVEWDFEGLGPGPYKVQAVATDSEGSVGKSALAAVVLKPR